MDKKKYRAIRWLAAAVLPGAICLVALLAIAGVTGNGKRPQHDIRIAFGFHVSLYHSFRNDTNNETGFGKDIRLIRHTIDTLDKFNGQGLPVKGVWEFDNLFSLQELLPKYAPDIVEDIRRRVKDNGDEVILMSYNNGLVSAMTEREAADAVRWSVSNPWNSGVEDIFGEYSPIVRPQEMMTTPGNFSIYKKAGVEAVCLYYSEIPFDAFRVFTRPLTLEEAHNPLLYENPETGEDMTIIPAYNIGDLMENVSLENWVEKLRARQKRGEIDDDLLLYINFDADSDFWAGVDLRWPLDRLPNTGGIEGLIREVKDLDYVRFTTLNDYLKGHRPKSSVCFGQDTADGSFNGYNSWSEKSDSHWYWTRIERNRRAQALYEKTMRRFGNPAALEQLRTTVEESYLKRLRALSTTHFGMATPFLAPQRQEAAKALLDELDAQSREIEAVVGKYLGRAFEDGDDDDRRADAKHILSFDLVDVRENCGAIGPGFFRVQLPDAELDGLSLFLEGPGVESLPVALLDEFQDANGTTWRDMFVPNPTGLADGRYRLYGKPAQIDAENRASASENAMSNGSLDVRFDRAGKIEGVFLDGVNQVTEGSLSPYVRRDGVLIGFSGQGARIRASNDGLSVSAKVSGTMPLPKDVEGSDGFADYTFTLVANRPYLFVEGEIQYPATKLKDICKKDVPALARRADMEWNEVAPAEIGFAPKASRDNPVRVLKRNYLGIESGYALDYFRHSPENLDLDDVNNHITGAYFGIVSGGRGMAVAKDNTVLSNFAFAPLKLRYDAKTGSFSVRANPFGAYHGKQYRPPARGNGQGYEAALLSGEQYASAAPTYNGAAYRFSLMIAFFEGEQIPEDIKRELIAFADPPVVVAAENGGKRAFAETLAPAIRFAENESADAFLLTDKDGRFAPPASMARTERPQHSPSIPLDLKLRVLWENVLASF